MEKKKTFYHVMIDLITLYDGFNILNAISNVIKQDSLSSDTRVLFANININNIIHGSFVHYHCWWDWQVQKGLWVCLLSDINVYWVILIASKGILYEEKKTNI